MTRQSLRSVPLEVFEKTFKLLDDFNLRYSIASQLLLKTFAKLSAEIRLNFDDDKFRIKKQLIAQSKMLKKFVNEKGLVLKISRKTKEKEFIAKLQNLPGVRSLDSEYGFHNMSNAALVEVGRNCKNLASLYVGMFFPDISQKPLFNTLSNLRKLKRLSFKNLNSNSRNRVNDLTLEIIGANNKELEDLDFTDCQNISDSGIEKLMQSFQSLKSLNLTRCISLSNEGLIAMVNSLMSLKTLNLNDIAHLEDRVLKEIAGRCKSIIDISLRGCEVITDEGIIGLAKNLRNLKK